MQILQQSRRAVRGSGREREAPRDFDRSSNEEMKDSVGNRLVTSCVVFTG